MRNQIENYRRQDEQPVERTQDERPEQERRIICPACNGNSGRISFQKGTKHFVPCARCNGAGTVNA